LTCQLAHYIRWLAFPQNYFFLMACTALAPELARHDLMPCSYLRSYCARHGEIRVAAVEEEPTRYKCGFISARIRRTYMSVDFPFSANDTSTELSRRRSWLSRFRPGIIQLACSNLVPLVQVLCRCTPTTVAASSSVKARRPQGYSR